VLRHTEAIEAIEVTDMASKLPIIRLLGRIHSMVRSLELVVVASRGVEAVAEHSVVDEGSVVGGKVQVVAWSPNRTGGDWKCNPHKLSP